MIITITVLMIVMLTLIFIRIIIMIIMLIITIMIDHDRSHLNKAANKQKMGVRKPMRCDLPIRSWA